MLIKERELKPLVLNPPPNIIRILDVGDLDKLQEFLEKTPDFGFDIETTPHKDFWFRRIRTMQFGNSEVQYVIDLRAFCNDNPAVLAQDLLCDCQGKHGADIELAPKIKKLVKFLEKYLCSDKWTKTGVNLSFEYGCLYWSFGLRICGLYDCMLAEKCIYAGIGGKASLKNYDFYSMESMVERYFGFSIDKSLQTSFNLEDEISDAQYEYAALDTRLPLGLKALQNLIASGETPKSLKAKGAHKLAEYFYYLDNLIFGDNLHSVIKIENEAIGSFTDMHLHGERIDTARWLKRVQIAEEKLKTNIENLDKIFVPIVGNKNEAIDDKYIEELEINWKTVRDTPTDEEIQLRLAIKSLNKLIKKTVISDEIVQLQLDVMELTNKLEILENQRKEKKEGIKAFHSDLKKKRTKINNLKADCEGNALINYGSDAQLLTCLKENFKMLVKLENLDDETLEKHEHHQVMKLIREYHGLSKDIGTYGTAWATQWKTKPGKEEGWLHPVDGKLHATYNQYDAGTGRSSSSQPNGQNLPQDPEIRHSFIADPPNEDIRISNCCEANAVTHGITIASKHKEGRWCINCSLPCSTHAEEYVIVTADQSGAELRIIAEDSQDEQWIGAFERGEDLHSVGTELLYPDEWVKEQIKSLIHPDHWTLIDCKNEVVKTVLIEGKEKKIGPCAFYAYKDNGDLVKQKCNCPEHKERRDDTKACNFLLAYGGGPATLAGNIKKPLKVAKALMALHEKLNPGIWAYLDKSGKKAKSEFKAFDLFGRRRILPEPTFERAKENCKEYNEKILRLSQEDCTRNINTFIEIKGRKPNQDETFELTHRQPNANEIGRSFYQMSNSIERQGKNMRIQGTNASISKIAMGCGYDLDGIPFLWHTLPKYKARLVGFVHDELKVHCPKQYGQIVANLIGDAFKRAAALRMKRVIMEFEYKIAPYWSK